MQRWCRLAQSGGEARLLPYLPPDQLVRVSYSQVQRVAALMAEITGMLEDQR